MISLNDYEFDTSQKLGRGSSGIVYMGYHKKNREKVAIKRLDISNFSKRMGRIWSEIEIMKGLSHPNIVKLYDVHLDIKNDYLYMILEYCDNSDLSEYIDRYVMDLEQVHGLMTQIKDGLEYLSSRGIVHRDLKPHNLLMNGDVVKIADFGLSTIISEEGGAENKKNDLMRTVCGSPLYMSPEIIGKQGYNSKSDLWSLGIIMYQLIYRRHPFEECQNFKELEYRVKTEEIQFPSSPPVNQLTMDLLKGLLSKNSEHRMTWDKFFNHPWFTYLPQMMNEHLDMSFTEEDGFNYGTPSKENSIRSLTSDSIEEEIENDEIQIENDEIQIEDDPHIGEFFSRPRTIPQKNSYRYKKYQERHARQSGIGDGRRVNLGSLVIQDYQKMPRDARQVHRVEEDQFCSRSAPVRGADLGYSPSKIDFQSMSSSFMYAVNKSLSWLKNSIDT